MVTPRFRFSPSLAAFWRLGDSFAITSDIWPTVACGAAKAKSIGIGYPMPVPADEDGMTLFVIFSQLLGLEADFSVSAGQVEGEGGQRHAGDSSAQLVHDFQSFAYPGAEMHGALDGIAMEEIIWLDMDGEEIREELPECFGVVVHAPEQYGLVD